ncbi:peptidoglycan-binding domain-containing protein [Dyella sp. SG609]|uniref:peptidoglycan-binding domain-containing protein n=1 Tax=Dyella sp. SG609 TaxID=2587018 RepID=UPI0014481CB4|nr:peptidoglycan-binding domain-containing protein [Dyella sp. SG609]NKJ21329.1 peptidoglycan hydrolase-like protein with peptidoglycan-binding domain [Dyella sp. SG609]
MGREILDEAYRHFAQEGRKYEYGRGDMSLKNGSPNHRSDPSRTEQDLDKDGYYGVDCSSLVWRGMKNAGYDVGNEPFATSKLYDGGFTGYAKQHFDIVPAEDARKTPGSLQPGDLLMFDSKHGRHVAIFKGYDDKGNIEFYGSQVSTGPALSKAMGPTDTKEGYWNGGDFKIVGAMRPKPEFQVHQPLHGHEKVNIPEAPNGPMVTRHHPAGHHAPTPPSHGAAPHPPATPAAPAHQPPAHPAEHKHAQENYLHKGARGGDVMSLQQELTRLGYPVHPDGKFGGLTDEALRKFQHDHKLEPDGIAGPRTMDAVRHQLEQQKQHGQEPKAPMRLDNPAHPENALYKQALDAVHRLDAAHQREPNHQSGQLAGSLAARAREEGLQRIDHAVLSDDAKHTYAVQGDLNSPFKRVAGVDTAQAVNTPLEKSTTALEHAASTQTQNAQHQQQKQQQAPAQAGPSVSH